MPNLRQKTRSVWHIQCHHPRRQWWLCWLPICIHGKYEFQRRATDLSRGRPPWIISRAQSELTHEWYQENCLNHRRRQRQPDELAARSCSYFSTIVIYNLLWRKKIRRDMRAESADTKRFWDINMCWSGEYNWRCRLIAINKASYSNVFSGSDGNGPRRSTTTCYIWKIQLTMRYKERTC